MLRGNFTEAGQTGPLFAVGGSQTRDTISLEHFVETNALTPDAHLWDIIQNFGFAIINAIFYGHIWESFRPQKVQFGNQN